jgi:hypothetical protein
MNACAEVDSLALLYFSQIYCVIIIKYACLSVIRMTTPDS